MAKEKATEVKTMDVHNQKLAALEAARAQIDKEFGKGSLLEEDMNRRARYLQAHRGGKPQDGGGDP